MLLFGERNPLVIASQVEEISFAIEEVGKRAENENYDAMTEQKKASKEEEALSKYHNEYAFNIDF